MNKKLILIALAVLLVGCLVFYYIFFIIPEDTAGSGAEKEVIGSSDPVPEPPLVNIGAILLAEKPDYIDKMAYSKIDNNKVMKADFKTVFKTVNKNDFIARIVGEKYVNWYELTTTGGKAYVLKNSVSYK